MTTKPTNNRTSRPDDANPVWTKEDFAKARSAADVLPQFIGKNAAEAPVQRGRGRPSTAERKVNQTLRLDSDVLEALRQEGSSWQTRINEILRENSPGVRSRLRA